MLSKTLKTAAGKLFDPLAKGLGKFGVKPNHITISGVALTMYAALLLYDQNIYYAFLWNRVYFVLSIVLFYYSFNVAKNKGTLINMGE